MWLFPYDSPAFITVIPLLVLQRSPMCSQRQYCFLSLPRDSYWGFQGCGDRSRKEFGAKEGRKKENIEKKIIAIQDLIKLLNILPVRSSYPLKEILLLDIFLLSTFPLPLSPQGLPLNFTGNIEPSVAQCFSIPLHQGGLGTKIPERMIFCLQLLLQIFLWNSLVAVWSSVLFENILGLFSIKGKAGREHSK